MSKKKIEPTDAMVDEAANALCLNATGTSLSFQDYADKHTYRHRARVALRVVLNHPDARGLFECDYTDYVHVDEAATRVEAAHEQGWDDAAQHIYNKGWEGVTALRKANPYRPAQELPTKAGTLIIPADGREYIEAEVWGETYHASEAILLGGRAWLGAWRSPHGIQTDVTPDQITTGTWKVDGEDSA